MRNDREQRTRDKKPRGKDQGLGTKGQGRKEIAVPENGAKTPFDVETIKELVGLMSQHELSEIDLREGTLRIRLRRGAGGAVTVAPLMAPMAPAAPTPVPAAPATAVAQASRETITIKSPTPGTFYVAPSP